MIAVAFIVGFAAATILALLQIGHHHRSRGHRTVSDRPPETLWEPDPPLSPDISWPRRVWRHETPMPSIRFRLDISNNDAIIVTVQDNRDPRDWTSFAVADGGVFVMNVTPDDLA